MSDTRIEGQVRIVGAGLLGASIGHALVASGVDVVLADASRTNLRLAVDYGAGRLAAVGDDPALVIVAVPPDATADVVAQELAAWPNALVTDVASVKGGILSELARRRRRHLPVPRLASARRTRARRSDLGARRPVHRPAVGDHGARRHHHRRTAG